MKNPLFQRGVDARLLISYMASKPIGSVVTYEELSRHLKKAVDASFPAWATAKRALIREYDQVWDTVPRTGFMRLNDDETVASRTEKVKRRTRGLVRRTEFELSSVDIDGLDEAKRKSLFALIAKLGVMRATTSDKADRKLTSMCTSDEKLPLQQVLDAIKEDEK